MDGAYLSLLGLACVALAHATRQQQQEPGFVFRRDDPQGIMNKVQMPFGIGNQSQGYSKPASGYGHQEYSRKALEGFDMHWGG